MIPQECRACGSSATAPVNGGRDWLCFACGRVHADTRSDAARIAELELEIRELRERIAQKEGMQTCNNMNGGTCASAPCPRTRPTEYVFVYEPLHYDKDGCPACATP